MLVTEPFLIHLVALMKKSSGVARHLAHLQTTARAAVKTPILMKSPSERKGNHRAGEPLQRIIALKALVNRTFSEGNGGLKHLLRKVPITGVRTRVNYTSSDSISDPCFANGSFRL